ncbi:unnamed protein product [Eruca vesicaria subsp. sativa]|uniref:PABC domain-containing protein n=1 Tax=Eruca vesicaria subsp. sativa TaxID=29727 RepID=A0ABC8LSB8_ERUVS|nr:unnamed protein product [Eruca vesicaria subsp. sativa]
MPPLINVYSIHDPFARAAFYRRFPIAVLTQALENRTPSEQRNLIGETLYPLVESLVPVFAAKVTGMLLELDRTLIFKLIESPEALKEKVTEAMDVLFKSLVSPTDKARRARCWGVPGSHAPI